MFQMVLLYLMYQWKHLMFFIINVLHMVIWEVLYLFLMYLVVVVGQPISHHLIHSGSASNVININNIHSTTFQSSLDQRVGSIESVSGSFITDLNSGIVSGANQITLGYISSSQVSSSIGFDGNRTVSNTDLPSVFITITLEHLVQYKIS